MTDGKQTVVHVVIGVSSISLTVIENIIRHSTLSNFFIVTKHANIAKYRALFEKYGSQNFILCDEIKTTLFSKAVTQLSAALLGRFSPQLTYLPYDVLKTLFRYRKHPVVLHGLAFSFVAHLLLLDHFQSLSYVCWGNAPKPPRKNISSTLFFLAQRHIYRGYKRIVCLITADKDDFEKVCGATNTTALIYQSNILDVDDPAALHALPDSARRDVLLGNSACCTASYLKLLPVLKKITATASVTCMLSYPEDDPEGAKKAVIETFASAFGDAFTPWTQQLDFKKYADRLKQHDLYICNEERQSGLCAIYVMLMYGKKVYLTGKNLAWVRENQFIVHDVKELETETAEGILRGPSPEERKHNHDRILEMLSTATLAKKWDLFYSQL